MRFIPGLLLLACLVAVPACGEEPAPGATLENAIDALEKQDGFHIELTAEMPNESGMDPFYYAWKGWMHNPDVSYFKMEGGPGTEVYSKGRTAVAREGRRKNWRVEDAGDDSKRVDPLKHLREFKKHTTGATFLSEAIVGEAQKNGERVRGVVVSETPETVVMRLAQGDDVTFPRADVTLSACRVVESAPPADSVRGLLDAMSIDEKDIVWERSKLSLHVWVGKTDGLIRKALASLDAEVNTPGAKPGTLADRIKPKATFEITDYNKDVGLDRIPADVRALLKLD